MRQTAGLLRDRSPYEATVTTTVHDYRARLNSYGLPAEASGSERAGLERAHKE